MFRNKSEEYILDVFKDANYTIKNYMIKCYFSHININYK